MALDALAFRDNKFIGLDAALRQHRLICVKLEIWLRHHPGLFGR